MAAKPIADVMHKGRRIVIDFDIGTGLTIKYAITVDGVRKGNYFAEEVMRWLANEMKDGPKP